MEITQVKHTRLSRKRLRRILWILFPVLIVLFLFGMMSEMSMIAGFGILFFVFTDLVILYIIAEKYYNWPIVFFIIFFTGIFFKRQHWPLGSFIGTMAIFLISFVSLANTIRFLINRHQNSFLRWFGSISGLIITLNLFGWIFMLQNWSRSIGDIFAYSGGILFILSILGMVFTLPNSNYISWTEIERKNFFRTVLIPMVIVFALIILTLVFEDGYRQLMNFDKPGWHITGLKLFNLEGMPKI